MKSIHLAGLLAVALLALGLGTAQAATYNFQPNPVDLYDLDHYTYYSWGMSWQAPVGEEVIGASISFSNIRNWEVETNRLYIDLLDWAATGVTAFTDNQAVGNAFNGWNPGNGHSSSRVQLHLFKDLPVTPQNLNYGLSTSELTSLKQYMASENRFGLGFDPDCHYYNDGITFTIETRTTTQPPNNSGAVPEPATMGMAGLGLFSLASAALRRRRQA